MKKVAFLASGAGSSARAIVEAARAGDLALEPVLLVTNSRKAAALEWARDAGLPTACIPTATDPDQADRDLADALVKSGAELVVLSGYLRRLGPETLARFERRILNVHPGPLPDFGGEGMYGRRVHEAVVASGRAETAIVIHLVDEEYDHGPEIARQAVPVMAGETAEALEARVKAAEPAFFVETLRTWRPPS
jgi:phosphoribosylglycinamide formyltransferase 1